MLYDEKVIRENDYVPSSVARTLKSRKSGIIGMIVHTLRYQVKVQETHKTPGQVSGKDEAETTAKTEAIKAALREAAGKYDITLTENELKDIDLTGDTLTVTREKDGQTITYTFQYKDAKITDTHTESKPSETTVDGKDAEDVKETTVTGTAYVTSGTISWSKKGEKGNYTASFVTPDSIFGTMPERPDPNDPIFFFNDT